MDDRSPRVVCIDSVLRLDGRDDSGSGATRGHVAVQVDATAEDDADIAFVELHDAPPDRAVIPIASCDHTASGHWPLARRRRARDHS